MIPYRFRSIANFMNCYSNYFTKGILKTKQFECDNTAKTSFHYLIGHRHVNIFLISIKSFLQFYNKIDVFIHDDGTLSEYDKINIIKHIKNINIISRDLAELEFNKLNTSSLLSEFRKNDLSFLKIFDPNIFGKTKKILIDSDTIFLKQPYEIIEWIESGSKSFYHTDKFENVTAATVFDENNISNYINVQHFFRENLHKINELLKINLKSLDYCSGFIGYNKQIDFSLVEQMIIKLQSIIQSAKEISFNQWGLWGLEQCLYAFLLYDSSFKLNTDEYFATFHRMSPSEQEIQNAKFIHFIGKFEHRAYLILCNEVIKKLK